jgi:hypothetical protein
MLADVQDVGQVLDLCVVERSEMAADDQSVNPMM